MVLSPRRRHGPLEPLPEGDGIAPIQFRLEARTEQLENSDGSWTGRGYQLCDPRTGAPLPENDFFFRIGGGIVAELAGAGDHLDALQAKAFNPGRTLRLVRPPSEGRDDEVPVVDVYDLSGTVKVGELPPDAADAVAFYGEETYRAALCLWEWRDASGSRVGLKLLLAPGWTIEELPEGAGV